MTNGSGRNTSTRPSIRSWRCRTAQQRSSASTLCGKFYEEDAEAVFQPIRAFFAQQGIESTFVHTIGHAAASIADLAEKGKFDLLILGSRGHGDLVNLVLGSVATKVLARCSTPVLLVR